MKKTGLLLAVIVAITFAAPPTLYAECQTYPNRSVHYFPDCACQACAGWAISNCTDCASGTGSCQSTTGPCTENPY